MDQPRYLIDIHTHCFPDAVAARAMANLMAEYNVTPVGDGTLGNLRQHMAASGVSASVVMPVATRPDQVTSINDWAASVNSRDVIVFGALHPDLADPAGEIERIIDLGLRGVKFQPTFQHFAPDERRMFPTYRALEGRLVVMFHAGDEIQPAPEVPSTPQALANVHHAFPGLAMIAAHFGGYRMWDDVRKHLVGTGVCFDTSYCPPNDLPDDEMRDLIRTHGARRILFGSDFPFGDPAPDIERLLALGLDREDIEAITWRNADRLLGLGLEADPASGADDASDQ
jgi:predicted TIM-barrel fold metal-dependent hydrolase